VSDKSCDTCGKYKDCRASNATWPCHGFSAWEPIEVKDKCPAWGKDIDHETTEVECACVDYDGCLKYGANMRNLRYTWASERWRGADWVSQVEGTDYKPLTSILRVTKIGQDCGRGCEHSKLNEAGTVVNCPLGHGVGTPGCDDYSIWP